MFRFQIGIQVYVYLISYESQIAPAQLPTYLLLHR